ncbi:hypothetical protein BvMPK_1889 [Phocaeicola vulgatus]|uniref:Uncharacterized protein n=1 Tax=Phocaeicola vulgatus TaxID=821 RepID=A0A0P0M2D8_PHOVU|nr:hypothetical protein BvMPK_1889 [Phocaeicola vulgatus]
MHLFIFCKYFKGKEEGMVGVYKLFVKNRKHIQQQIKINKTLIDNFLKLNVENRT